MTDSNFYGSPRFEVSPAFDHFGQIFYDSAQNVNGTLFIRDKNIEDPYSFTIAQAYELGGFRVLELDVPQNARTPLVKCQILGSCAINLVDEFIMDRVSELNLRRNPFFHYGEVYMGEAIFLQEVLRESDYTTGNPTFIPTIDCIRCYDGFRVEPPASS